MTTLSDKEIEDIAAIAHRLAMENDLAAKQIAQLEQANVQLTYERNLAHDHRIIAWLVPPILALALGIAVGWRLGSDGQWDAGWRAARSEADQCP